tara:strand:- start:17779 stop:18699 length:921 start_codon:yes stop_codon:yes gene_type:complete
MKYITIFLLLASLTTATNYYVQDDGYVNVHFCPDCQNDFNSLIIQAQDSLDCAFFELSNPSTVDIIKSKNISKRIIIDNLYRRKFNTNYTKSDLWGLMHNKFCIIDDNIVITGSMNPTVNGMKKNNNNLVVIKSKYVSNNYQDEFNEMWNGTFKKGMITKTPSVDLGETKLSTYFCPEDDCRDQVIKELRQAKNSILFMIFSFTDFQIANTLLAKHLAGIKVEGIMEARQISIHSQYHRLSRFINVTKDKNKNNLHHKVFIIDEKTVITGSFNPSKNGNTRNDENLLIIRDEYIAQQFLDEYQRVK